MDHSPNLFPLKVVVISLGLLLLVGIAVFFIVFAHKLNADIKAARCPDVTVHLAGKGSLSGVTPQGNNVQIIMASGPETKVMTVDRCTGTLLQTLTVAP